MGAVHTPRFYAKHPGLETGCFQVPPQYFSSVSLNTAPFSHTLAIPGFIRESLTQLRECGAYPAGCFYFLLFPLNSALALKEGKSKKPPPVLSQCDQETDEREIPPSEKIHLLRPHSTYKKSRLSYFITPFFLGPRLLLVFAVLRQENHIQPHKKNKHAPVLHTNPSC